MIVQFLTINHWFLTKIQKPQKVEHNDKMEHGKARWDANEIYSTRSLLKEQEQRV